MRRAIKRIAVRFAVVGGVSLFIALASTVVVRAQGNVIMGLDALIVNNSGGGQPGWGGFGRFNYSNTVGVATDLGRYGAFTVSEPGASGSGVGVNFALGSPAIDSPRDSAGFQ